MTNREQHWLDEALPDELRRVLENAHGAHGAQTQSAQVARLRVRLTAVIGPAFGAPPAAEVEPASGVRAIQAGAQAAFIAKLVAPLCLFALGFGATWWGIGGSVRRPVLQPIAAVPLAPAPETKAAPPAAVAPPPSAAENTAPSAAAKPAPKAPRELGLSEELRQLENIRAALDRSPERALALADAQQHRFAHGALGPERELLRIDAWLRLGQYERARTRAEQLLAQPSAHPYRAQITRLLADYRAATAHPGAP